MTSTVALNPVDFPLSGVRLIEASAGTGKTYTIAALYVRLILGHDPESDLPPRELLPPDILVVTFTEAATKELRERIRDRLSQAVRFFRGQPVDSDEFLEAVRAHYDIAVWPACARRLEVAVNWMDEAAVYTIHGWCNRMLQQHAFDSGSLLRQEVDTDDITLLHEVVRDYWRTFYYGMASGDPDFQTLYTHFKQPDDLLKVIQALLNNSDPIDPCLADYQNIKTLLTTVHRCRQETLQVLKEPWKKWADEVKSHLETSVKNKALPAKNFKSNYIRNWMEKITAWSSDPAQETLDLGTGFTSLTPEGMMRLVNEGHTPPAHPGFEAISQLPRQLASLPGLKAELIKHATHWIRNRYDSEKQRVARMTFDDMLTRLDKALQCENGHRLASAIRQQYPVALIDEFQDTDPIQYRIFSTLYPADSDSGSGCFMIGDPKQAIYSFRGADIHTYLKAHQLTMGRHYTLGTNFRSTKALVDAVNQVFLHADRQSAGAFRFKQENCNTLPFIAVKAKGREEEWLINDRPAPALTFWHWESDEAVGMPDYRKTMAEVAASEIVRLLNAGESGRSGFKSAKGLQPLQPSDIAILVRSGREARAMRNALAIRRLRSVYLSERDSIFATQEAADLLVWLKALADPRNERKVRAALGTATFGWSYQALQKLASDEPDWEQQLERFLHYQQRWQQDGILPALRQLINDHDLHARLTPGNEGERRITNLLHLAELLQHAGSHLEGEQALIRHLAESIEAGGNRSGDESIIRLESDANLIKIITIHKSKGLEYPLVFLPFICSFREVNGRFNSYYRYHDDQQNLHIDLSKSEENKEKSDSERLQEDLRLLYVAMTRARHACWLGIAPIKAGPGKACELEKSAFGSLLGWNSGTPANELERRLTELKGDCASIAITAFPVVSDDTYAPAQPTEPPESTRLASAGIPNDWWIASYSALSTEDKLQTEDYGSDLEEPETAGDDKRNDEAEPDHEPASATPIGVHGLPRGAGPGVLIHDLFEHCAHLGFMAVHLDPKLRKELIQKRVSSNDWASHQDIIDSALSRWLALPLLENSDICLGKLELDAYRPELEFLIGAETVDTQALDRLVTQYTFSGQPRPALLPTQINGLLKGFIDLVFVHERRYYVVDYKFNSLGSSDEAYTPESLAAAMLVKRYDLQYALYLLALHRLLKVRLGESYDYDSHIGGSLYLFLRGAQSPTRGRLFDKPPRMLIERLDRLFSGGETR